MIEPTTPEREPTIGERLDRVTVELEKSRRANKWSRIRDGLLGALAIIDVVIWVNIIGTSHHANSVNDCRNRHAQQFNLAEKAKVRGQIAGWEQQITGLRRQLGTLQALIGAKTQQQGEQAFQAYLGATSTSIDGLQHAIDKSVVYLHSISAIPESC